ncbi:MAG TPA: hypothetical protein VF173_27150 [Thermoanaerobaculia bacterium]|nr:hypothetical protein [Thermoanaerobaculia bacterium]
MIRRKVTFALALVFSLTVLSLSSWADDSVSSPKSCPSKSVDATSPEMKALLSSAKFIRTLGTPEMHQTSTSNAASQTFEIVDSSGNTTTVTVVCQATGCISGCATTGCNPTLIDGQPACTPLVCKNSSGFPCPNQGTCSKTVTQAGSSGTGN